MTFLNLLHKLVQGFKNWSHLFFKYKDPWTSLHYNYPDEFEKEIISFSKEHPEWNSDTCIHSAKKGLENGISHETITLLHGKAVTAAALKMLNQQYHEKYH